MNEKILSLPLALFSTILKANLSPNQYYILCCINEKISISDKSLHLDLKFLINEQWLLADYTLTQKAVDFIKEIAELFVTPGTIFIADIKAAPVEISKKTFSENVLKYRDIFPNKKLPSGKAARCSPGNLEKAFKWFFETYKYSWEIIFKATELYVNEQQKSGDKYMRTSQYFVRKDNMSDLADLCEAILTDGYKEEQPLFSTKVV
jgi:hypothetical protein